MFAVLWAFLAFAGGDDDEGIPVEDAESDTTTTTEAEVRTSTTRRRRPPTTTTTQVIPGAPLLGEPTGLELVVVGGTGRVIDLDTGAVTDVVVPVRGVTAAGLLVSDGSGLATWPPPFDGSSWRTILPPAQATRVELLWVVGDGRLVWALERPEDDRSLRSGWSMSLVDLDGAVLGSFELPSEVWPAGATDHGLVVTGPGGAYLMDATGAAERISTGDPFSVVGDRIHVVDCDDVLRCNVEVFDGRGRLIHEQSSPASLVGWGTAAPDGRVAFVEPRGEFGERSALTIDGVTVLDEPGSLGAGGQGGLAWSPDGRWLAIAAQDGIHLVDTLGDGGDRVIDPGQVDEASSVFFLGPSG